MERACLVNRLYRNFLRRTHILVNQIRIRMNFISIPSVVHGMASKTVSHPAQNLFRSYFLKFPVHRCHPRQKLNINIEFRSLDCRISAPASASEKDISKVFITRTSSGTSSKYTNGAVERFAGRIKSSFYRLYVFFSLWNKTFYETR